jgi:hypothetical protein
MRLKHRRASVNDPHEVDTLTIVRCPEMSVVVGMRLTEWDNEERRTLRRG